MSRRSRKKKGRIIHIIVAVLIIVLLIIIGLFLLKKIAPENKRKTENKIEKVDNIENYDYNLYKNSSKLYKKYYNELKTVLNANEIDEEKYAKLVS